jgi:hypothetical protein
MFKSQEASITFDEPSLIVVVNFSEFQSPGSIQMKILSDYAEKNSLQLLQPIVLIQGNSRAQNSVLELNSTLLDSARFH